MLGGWHGVTTAWETALQPSSHVSKLPSRAASHVEWVKNGFVMKEEAVFMGEKQGSGCRGPSV